MKIKGPWTVRAVSLPRCAATWMSRTLATGVPKTLTRPSLRKFSFYLRMACNLMHPIRAVQASKYKNRAEGRTWPLMI